MTCWFFMGWSNKDSLYSNFDYFLLPGSWECFSPGSLYVSVPIQLWTENPQAPRKLIFSLDTYWHTLSNQKLPLCLFYWWGNWGSMDEINCLRKIPLDKAVTEHCQSLFNTAVAIRELNATLGFLHVSNYFGRGFFVAEWLENPGDAGMNACLQFPWMHYWVRLMVIIDLEAEGCNPQLRILSQLSPVFPSKISNCSPPPLLLDSWVVFGQNDPVLIS